MEEKAARQTWNRAEKHIVYTMPNLAFLAKLEGIPVQFISWTFFEIVAVFDLVVLL